ncbi:MAG: tRNA preQ1(34) S-adenosylmethionine ribosyltransferase-isomerase QueA [Bacilli bacterium]
MDIEEYNYDLPKNLIAQTPLKDRSASRLLVMDKLTGALEENTFKNITKYFNKGDVLVLNDTKVIPARLIGIKEETNAVIELLLLKNIENNKWECLAKPAKRLSIGTIISFGDSILKCEVISKKDEGLVEVNFIYEGIFMEILDSLGTMPLPPYIHEKLEDQSRYQTVYSREVGSAAAPTAGLHFTSELLEEVKKMGVELVFVTLHVGLGTFRPVEEADITKHHMHSEYYIMSKSAADSLNKAKLNGNKIYAVGTTSTRVLETILSKNDSFIETSGNTDIFIYPGFTYKAIDGLITNFHLPKSTLLMLVSALSSKEYILNAYQYAIKNDFRFFSFGDAMFIK